MVTWIVVSGLNYHLTAVLNTDGINLYPSSKVELWPIFIAINDLSPTYRFARENLLLIGIWQGKGKPPFNSKVLMEQEGTDLNQMYNEWVQVVVKDKVIFSKLTVISGVFDLPAKASLLYMTYFNGSCFTCEEPGLVVKQGKGNGRCFPYREETEKAKVMRKSRGK